MSHRKPDTIVNRRSEVLCSWIGRPQGKTGSYRYKLPVSPYGQRSGFRRSITSGLAEVKQMLIEIIAD